jgi:hypothetical protein
MLKAPTSCAIVLDIAENRIVASSKRCDSLVYRLVSNIARAKSSRKELTRKFPKPVPLHRRHETGSSQQR